LGKPTENFTKKIVEEAKEGIKVILGPKELGVDLWFSLKCDCLL